MSFIFCFVKSRIYLFLLVFFTHAFMCLLSVSGIYRFIQLCCCLHWQLIDSSQVKLFLGMFNVLSQIVKGGVCQILRLQGLNVLELQCVMCWQTMIKTFSLVLDLLKVCLCAKLELSVIQDLLCKSAWLDRLRIRLN